MEVDSSYWKNATEENHLAFLKSHGYKSIEDFKKRQIKKRNLFRQDYFTFVTSLTAAIEVEHYKSL